jgi:hypothetical protein
MKKLFIILAAVVMVFVSCKKDNKDNNTVNPTPTIAEQILGKWFYIEENGEAVDTDELTITSFVMEDSTMKAYTSQLVKPYDMWFYKQPTDVQNDGDKLTLTMQKDTLKTVEELTNITFSDDRMSYTSMYTVFINGEPVEVFGPNQLCCIKGNNDYSQSIIGLWECTELVGAVTYNDSNARLEFFADGSYNFYSKDEAGIWNLVPRELNEYFVDDKLLATRWKSEGEPVIYESWEIVSLVAGNMEWNSIRYDADGNIYAQVMKWKIIN